MNKDSVTFDLLLSCDSITALPVLCTFHNDKREFDIYLFLLILLHGFTVFFYFKSFHKTPRKYRYIQTKENKYSSYFTTLVIEEFIHYLSGSLLIKDESRELLVKPSHRHVASPP
jgi:hypothetical protein